MHQILFFFSFSSGSGKCSYVTFLSVVFVTRFSFQSFSRPNYQITYLVNVLSVLFPKVFRVSVHLYLGNGSMCFVLCIESPNIFLPMILLDVSFVFFSSPANRIHVVVYFIIWCSRRCDCLPVSLIQSRIVSESLPFSPNLSLHRIQKVFFFSRSTFRHPTSRVA